MLRGDRLGMELDAEQREAAVADSHEDVVAAAVGVCIGGPGGGQEIWAEAAVADGERVVADGSKGGRKAAQERAVVAGRGAAHGGDGAVDGAGGGATHNGAVHGAEGLVAEAHGQHRVGGAQQLGLQRREVGGVVRRAGPGGQDVGVEGAVRGGQRGERGEVVGADDQRRHAAVRQPQQVRQVVRVRVVVVDQQQAQRSHGGRGTVGRGGSGGGAGVAEDGSSCGGARAAVMKTRIGQPGRQLERGELPPQLSAGGAL